MPPLRALGLLVAMLCPAVLCHPGGTGAWKTQAQEHEDPRRLDSLKLASSNTDFALSLYQQLALRSPSKNIIFSPLSISTALAFLSLGARKTTLTEILEGLKFNLTETPEAEIHRGFQHLLRTLGQPNNQLELSTGNVMFVKEQLKLLARFVEDARELYAAQAFSTSFQNPAAARKFINNYVKNKTHGKIANLVQNLGAQTAMMLVNYMFFKAKWKEPFDPNDTFESRFYVSQNKWVKVPMMNLKDVRMPYFRDEALACTLVGLKYTGNASALFILPDKGKMAAVEAGMLPETLSRWMGSLQTRQIDDLFLPKFSISSNYDLSSVLPQLGISKAFSRQADLSGITGERNLVLSQVVHKAMLDVAEKGTEAAAATGVSITLLSAKLDPQITVNFNRPFLIIIVWEDTHSILFMGKITNPKQD